MATTCSEILENPNLFFHVGDIAPSSEDYSRISKMGGKLIKLSSPQFRAAYTAWQELLRETEGPFAGHLVRVATDLSTSFDIDLDILETVLDRGRNPKVGDLDAETYAEYLARIVAQNPELSADKISDSELAKLICGITIVHRYSDIITTEDRDKLLSLDPDDPEHMKELIKENRLPTEEMGGIGHWGTEDSDWSVLDDETEDQFAARLKAQAENIEREKNLSPAKKQSRLEYEARYVQEDRLEELAETVTTLDAARQLEKEAGSYGFTVNQYSILG